jgi:dienelactone hydrolase
MTKAWYHLYLPMDYVRNGGNYPNHKMARWPLVMTFHGMKPYDNALPQEREWEKQADNYGYIVCAPDLETSDSFMEYPLTKEHSYVLADKRNVLAIMDHVFATTRADPKRVLSTSWSCGGYLAHYFPNRFPDRFSCIATRLSNFCGDLMVEESVPLYRDKVPVAVFIGDGDFPACKYESEEAVAWYTSRGFRVVRGKMIDHMGHRRIPQTAAAFFAEQLGIEPLHPLEAAQAVAEVQMSDYFPSQDLLAKVSPRGGPILAMGPKNDSMVLLSPATKTDANKSSTGTPSMTPPRPNFTNATAGRKYPSDRRPTYDPTPQIEPNGKTGPQPVAPAPAPDHSKNWLEAPKQAPTDQPSHSAKPAEDSARPKPTAAQGKPAQQDRTADARSTSSRQPVASADKSSRSSSKTSPPPKTTTKTSPKSPPEPVKLATAAPSGKTAEQQSPSQFTPQDAGRRDYDRLMESRPHDSAHMPAQPPRTLGKSDSQVAAGTSGAPRGKAQHVNIRISGPAIGTAPHYLRYSVDLPRDKTQNADFLWMDNGVWLGDEASGAKILESPGLHFITVLVVTREGVEYRGQAKVQVLERTASSFKGPDGPG